MRLGIAGPEGEGEGGVKGRCGVGRMRDPEVGGTRLKHSFGMLI